MEVFSNPSGLLNDRHLLDIRNLADALVIFENFLNYITLQSSMKTNLKRFSQQIPVWRPEMKKENSLGIITDAMSPKFRRLHCT